MIKKSAIKKFTEYKNTLTRIKGFLRNKKGVYWWGAGSAFTIFLNQIDKRILKKFDLTIVDGDKNKRGMHIPGIDLCVNPFTILRNRKIDNLIIASSFQKEIRATIKNNNITVKNSEVFF